jgi:hypothetical protein
LTFISNLHFIILNVTCFFNFIPQHSFISILVFILFNSFFFLFWILFCWFVFLILPLIIFLIESLASWFFWFWIYGSIQFHDLCHEFKIVDRVRFSYFKFFFKFDFFQFQPSILCWLGICNHYFFTFFLWIYPNLMSQVMDLMSLLELTRVFFTLLFFLHLQHLIHLIMKLYDFIRFVFNEIILVLQLDRRYGLMAWINLGFFFQLHHSIFFL